MENSNPISFKMAFFDFFSFAPETVLVLDRRLLKVFNMALNIYWTSLFILMPIVVLFIGRHVILRLFRTKNLEKNVVPQDVDVEAQKFRRTFLRVYLVVMGSEWLQVSWWNQVLMLQADCFPRLRISIRFSTMRRVLTSEPLRFSMLLYIFQLPSRHFLQVTWLIN